MSKTKYNSYRVESTIDKCKGKGKESHTLYVNAKDTEEARLMVKHHYIVNCDGVILYESVVTKI